MLELAMDGTQAWEALNSPQSRQMGMEEFERLLLRAGYSREDAHRAALQRGWDRMSAGEMV